MAVPRAPLTVTTSSGPVSRFDAPDRFQWQSQNRQHCEGATEQKLARHVELGIPVHLFVRKTPKAEGRAAHFSTVASASSSVGTAIARSPSGGS